MTTALQAHLDAVGDLSPDAFDRFSQLIPADWIEQALQATGTASLRRRRLPAERLIWLVIGLALFRNEPIWHIVRQLGLALDIEQVVPVPSATVQGRQRLGEAPLAHLFDQLSRAWCRTPLPASGLFQGLACWPSMAWCGQHPIPLNIAKSSVAGDHSTVRGVGRRCVRCA